MTIEEFSLEFDTVYNNLNTGSAPPIDGYEKSLLLTKAQELLVQQWAELFEVDEKSRKNLEALVEHIEIDSTEAVNQNTLNTKSFVFDTEEDILRVVLEKIKILDEGCYVGKELTVVPQTHDTYNKQIKNPFRKPKLSGRYNVAWRINNGNFKSEIIVPEQVSNFLYIYRYIKKPSPIILEDLSLQSLSIDGIDEPTECELNPITHRAILDKALELAKLYYENGDLSSIVQMNDKDKIN